MVSGSQLVWLSVCCLHLGPSLAWWWDAWIQGDQDKVLTNFALTSYLTLSCGAFVPFLYASIAGTVRFAFCLFLPDMEITFHYFVLTS